MNKYTWLIMMLCAGAAQAELSMPTVFSDNMVLQRGKPVPIWGSADPDGSVSVSFAGQTKTTAADKSGQWLIRLDPLTSSAKGQKLSVTSTGKPGTGNLAFTNVLVGDVWLCSGQSNMDYEVAGGRRGKRNLLEKFDAEANYPAIRHFAVPEKSAVIELDDTAKTTWAVCSPATVSQFSAVGYFYGRMIHRRTDVPIGLISSAVGGTKIESWARAGELGKVDGCEEAVARVVERGKMIKDGTFTMEKAMDIWAAKNDLGSAAKGSWGALAHDDSDWKTVPVPTRWSGTEVAELKPFNGIVWLRRAVEIPARFAGKDLVVSVGKVDDRETTFFNGVRIGGSVQYDDRRIYTAPGKLVKAGKNVVAVRVWNGWGDGGIWGSPKEMSVYPVGHEEEKISLAGDWLFKRGLPANKMTTAPMRMGVKSRENLATGLYNGMIAPVAPFAISGAIWYQGESNGGEGRAYTHKMRALIEGWRAAWGQGAFPFYFVQLANFEDAGDDPEGGDGWARMRMAQLQALEIENTGMAVAIDLADTSNPRDVHPENKKDVGERLALWALANDYGKKITYSGPLYKGMSIKGGEAIISFDHVGEGLMVGGEKTGIEPVKSVQDGTLKRFAISGEDRKWHWADASIEGETVVVSSPEVTKPVAVRYAYTRNPDGCNLYNKAGLPASPFTTDKHWH